MGCLFTAIYILFISFYNGSSSLQELSELTSSKFNVFFREKAKLKNSSTMGNQ
jgi:hypothetical protein